jgi:hypothetical protein
MNLANRVAMVIAFIGLAYVGWSLHRMSSGVIVMDSAWPRPFPYPDPWLDRFHQWLDARNPPPAGAMKMHGEVFKVRLTLWLVQAGLAGLLALSLAPTLKQRKCQQTTEAD